MGMFGQLARKEKQFPQAESACSYRSHCGHCCRQLMEEGSGHRMDATKLLLHTAARVLSALEASYNGELNAR